MNYNHLMEKYELYGGIFVHLTKVKKIQPNLFPICNTLWNSQRRHKKSSNRNGQLHFFFQNFSSQRSFFWNRESFNKMFTIPFCYFVSLKNRSENSQPLYPLFDYIPFWMEFVRYLKRCSLGQFFVSFFFESDFRPPFVWVLMLFSQILSCLNYCSSMKKSIKSSDRIKAVWKIYFPHNLSRNGV